MTEFRGSILHSPGASLQLMDATESGNQPNDTVDDLRAGLADQVKHQQQLERAITQIQPLLVHVARRCMRNLDDPSYGPEDIAQDAWANTLDKIRRIVQQPETSTRSVLAYLCKAVRWLAKDAMKSLPNQRRVTFGGNPPEQADAATGVVTRLARKERRSELMLLLDSIPEKYRNAWLLREVEGVSDRDAAIILDISRETVRQRVHRAKQMLLGRLQGSVLDELA